jgi:transposase
MLNEAGADRVYLACGVTDLRKSIDGLAVLVKEVFDLNPFSSSLYCFAHYEGSASVSIAPGSYGARLTIQ